MSDVFIGEGSRTVIGTDEPTADSAVLPVIAAGVEKGLAAQVVLEQPCTSAVPS